MTKARKGSTPEEKLNKRIKFTFDKLNEELKAAGYELVIRRPVLKELTIFDYVLLFERGNENVQIYLDENIKQTIDYLLETNQQVVIKSNWYSPDTIVIHVPLEDASVSSPQPFSGTEEVET